MRIRPPGDSVRKQPFAVKDPCESAEYARARDDPSTVPALAVISTRPGREMP